MLKLSTFAALYDAVSSCPLRRSNPLQRCPIRSTLPDQVKDPRSVGDKASFRQQSFGNAANSVAFIDLPGSPT